MGAWKKYLHVSGNLVFSFYKVSKGSVVSQTCPLINNKIYKFWLKPSTSHNMYLLYLSPDRADKIW